MFIIRIDEVFNSFIHLLFELIPLVNRNFFTFLMPVCSRKAVPPYRQAFEDLAPTPETLVS